MFSMEREQFEAWWVSEYGLAEVSRDGHYLGHTLTGWETWQAARASMALVALKDHQIAQLTNELRDTAIKYRDAQQLRERIAMIIRPLFKPQVP